jgi:hypothetical protein
MLLPRRAGNDYRGQKLALWIFGLVVLLRLAMSLNAIFNGPQVARTADGIPLDTFNPAAAQTVVAIFGLLGVSRLIDCVLGVVVLARYRALVPLMFLLLLLHQGIRGLFLRAVPIVRVGDPPASIVNLVLLALIVLGFALSLWPRTRSTVPPSLHPDRSSDR